MDNVVESFEALKEYLVQNQNAKVASGGKEIVKRCHVCGDSSDPTKAHMYIGMKDEAILYNCFKCNAKGIVDNRFLRDIGCYDISLINLVKSQKSIRKYSEYADTEYKLKRPFCYKLPTYNYNNPTPKLISIFDKFNYLWNRISINPWAGGIQDFNGYIHGLRLILSINDFFECNNITKITRDPRVVDILERYYIGFLSVDERYINFRRLLSDEEVVDFYSNNMMNLGNDILHQRYVIYNIDGTKGGNKLYVISGCLDLDKPETPKIHVAEGCFDIISIYMNELSKSDNDGYFALNGKSYTSFIDWFIRRYGLMNIEYHFYLDNDYDINHNDLNIIMERVISTHSRLFIHRNEYPGEKDYGVPIERIQDVWRQIV